jgi:hypothetical protein
LASERALTATVMSVIGNDPDERPERQPWPGRQ